MLFSLLLHDETRAFGADAITVNDAITAQRLYFAKIQTCDLYFSQDQVGFSFLPAHQSGHLIVSGARFRAETGLDVSVSPPRPLDWAIIHACNLKKDQQFRYQNFDLRVTGPGKLGLPYPQDAPLLNPYTPATPNASDRTFNTLKSDEDLWGRLKPLCTIEGTREFAGRQCWSIAIRRDGTLDYRWFLAIDLNLYPIGYEQFDRKSGQLSVRYVVDQPRSVPTTQGEVVFPVLATATCYSSDGQVSGHITSKLLEQQLSVNQPVDDGVFTINPSLALTYEDTENPANNFHAERRVSRPQNQGASTTQSLSAGPAYSDEPIQPSPAWFRPVIIGAMASLLLGALMLYLWKSRSTRGHPNVRQ